MKYILAVLFIFICIPAFALDETQRVANLFDTIKCPTCHGQSIKDSNSESAELIRKNVSRLVNEGASDEQIYTRIRSIYGEDAVTVPSHSMHNMLLWIFPAGLLLFLGMFFRNTFIVK